MKKILSLALALVLTFAVLCAPASAIDLDNKTLYVQIWAQDTATWSWKAVNEGSQVAVALGDTVEVVYNDVSNWISLDTSASINMGLQILDQTLTANGEHSQVKYELSDLVIKAKGYDDLVVKVAGTYDKTHDTVRPDWTQDDSVVGGSAEDYNFSPADIGITATADYIDWFNAIESMTVTVTYLAYNGEEAAAAPADEAPAVEPAPADEAPAAEAPAAETPAATAPAANTKPANTGVVLAVLPMAVAAAAVVVSKRR